MLTVSCLVARPCRVLFVDPALVQDSLSCVCLSSLFHTLSHSLAGPAALFVDPELLPDFDGCQLLPPTADTGAAAVVLGDMGHGWNYGSLNSAFRLMMAQPSPLLITLGKARCVDVRVRACVSACACTMRTLSSFAAHMSRAHNHAQPCSFYKDADGGLSLDVGPFTAAVEFASGASALVLGKPSPRCAKRTAACGMRHARHQCVGAASVWCSFGLWAQQDTL